jgi:pimeloyl-ACP methyl ester carboxylesterase
VPSLTTADGRTLAWRVRGSGPPLVLHPGGPGCSSEYFGELPELASARTLLLLDPRGTGGSDRPADPSGYDLEDYAADIEALRVHLGVERLDLLGHSHGGFVAMTWASTHPDRVRRLIIASSAPRFTPVIREMRAARIASHEGEPHYEDSVAAFAAHEAGGFASDAELSALSAREYRVFAPVGIDPSGILGALRRAGNNADALRHFNSRIAAGMDQRAALASVTSPTLVLVGELDAFGVAPGEEIAAALPDATLAVLPRADHFPFLESADHRAAWSRTVLEFLE